jgi:hypothetical protein
MHAGLKLSYGLQRRALWQQEGAQRMSQGTAVLHGIMCSHACAAPVGHHVLHSIEWEFGYCVSSNMFQVESVFTIHK